MAIFGVPLKRTSDEQVRRDAVAAVDCALALEAALERLNATWRKKNQPEVGMRVGIHTGPLVAGSVGSAERLDYTVVGDTVNIAQRLEALGKEAAPDAEVAVLLSADTKFALDAGVAVEPLGPFVLRGRDEPLEVYRLQLSEGGRPS